MLVPLSDYVLGANLTFGLKTKKSESSWTLLKRNKAVFNWDDRTVVSGPSPLLELKSYSFSN
jgi:hypothetical protein